MFDEYEFLKYCEEQYLSGLGQDDAHKEIEEDTVSESVKSQSAWTLVCWLGEYQKTID